MKAEVHPSCGAISPLSEPAEHRRPGPDDCNENSWARRTMTALERIPVFPLVARILKQPAVTVLLVAASALTGYVTARASPPQPIVVTVSSESLEAQGRRGPRGSVLLPTTTQTTSAPTTTQVACTLPPPDSSATCVNGFWQAAAAATEGSARFDRANGCVTVQPANDMMCRNGLWTLRGSEAATISSPPVDPSSPPVDPTRPLPAAETSPEPSSASSLPSATSLGASSTCSAARPAILPTQSLVCVSGSWVVR